MESGKSDKFEIKHNKDTREITLVPKGKKIEGCLVWLHGLGDSAEGFFPIFGDAALSPLPDSFKVRLLTAPVMSVTVNMGMRMNSWYDITNFDRSESSFNYDDVLKNSQIVKKVMDEEVEFFEGDSTKLMIGGFSQGCAMALQSGLTYGKPLKGIIGLSGYLFPRTKLPPKLDFPIFISHGEADPVINFEYAQPSYDRLKEIDNLKNMFEFHKIPHLEHSLDIKVLELIKKFVKKIV